MQAALSLTRLRRPLVIALAAGCAASIASEAPAAPLLPMPALSAGAFAAPARLELEDPLESTFGFDRFARPDVERPSRGTSFLAGRYGLRSWNMPRLELDGAPSVGGRSLPPLRSPMGMALSSAPLHEDQALRLQLDLVDMPAPRKNATCTRRAIPFVRYGGESDSFPLVACDGSLLADALDRLSVIARPAGADRPPMPLPDDPDPHAVEAGEWVDHVRLLNPRLAWAVERVAEAFPWKTVYVISGYRPTGHGGLHAQGRAIDLFVMNVPNERVYKLCRTLPDVGCGYYPNSKFVHVDVRRPGTGKAYWIDDSAPGQPSHYVDSWPGVEKSGGAGWNPGAH